FGDRTYLLEEALTGDFAFVKAWRGDTHGNLVFRKTARNFNPLTAKAARITIAEVEELVPAGEIDPDSIHLPGIYVQRVVQGQDYQKWIEQRTVRTRGEA
ncbi:MAG: CoA-transferase, partial [Myxococcota bacterium]|nr:CoA-transferase [Myxococcota bacterium]